MTVGHQPVIITVARPNPITSTFCSSTLQYCLLMPHEQTAYA